MLYRAGGSLLLVLCWSMTVWAQPISVADRKQARAMRVGENAIHLDGRLDEEVWLHAQPVTDFVQKEPNEGAAPSDPTEVRFVFDDNALYVGARLHARSRESIRAPLGRRDSGEQAEYLLVSLDTYLDRRTAYTFGVTAAGVRLDHYHGSDSETRIDDGFDPLWEAKVHIDDNGWTAEMWIPLAQLRFADKPEQTWGLNLHRWTPSRDEDDYWVLVPRTQQGWSSRFGDLRGVETRKKTRRLELMPYAASTFVVSGAHDAGNPFNDGSDLGGRAGMDLKMGLGPNLTLEATVNPDFGQVEADPAEVNLSAFETILRERRGFFIEGSRLLNGSVVDNFFYSRRIGAAPTLPVTGDYLDYPRSTTILGAAKLTGRLASGLSVAALGAVTDSEVAGAAFRTSPLTTSTRVVPRTAYSVARLQQEFGPAQSTASLMLTGMRRDVAPGDPLAAYFTRNAFSVSGDSVMRFRGGEYEFGPYGGLTFVSGDAGAIKRVQDSSARYFQRPDNDYAHYDPTRTSLGGYKAGATMDRVGGRHWLWNLKLDFESPGLETNDIGRLFQGDGVQTVSGIKYRETRPGRVLRGYTIGTNLSQEWNYGGDRQNRNLRTDAALTWRNFWTSSASLTIQASGQDERLTRGGPIMERPPGWTSTVTLGSRPSAQTAWSGTVTYAGSDGGSHSTKMTGSVSIRPSPRWQISIAPNYEREVNTQQYFGTLAGGRSDTFGKRYVFATIDRNTLSTQFRLGYTLKPDLNLDVYMEPFAASGDYGAFGELAQPGTRELRTYGLAPGTTAMPLADGALQVEDNGARFSLANRDFNVQSLRSNLVVRWEWRPGSTMYVVWQQDRHASEATGNRVTARDLFGSFNAPGDNYFVVKTSFWLPVR